MSAGELSASVNVANVLVHEGDYVNVGTPIFTLTSDSAEKLIRTYKNSLNSAEATVESAQEKLDTTQDSYEDYTITAPIAGKIITKTYKLGDKIGTSSGSTSATTLASIYDMSQYTFEMSIDELDVMSVELGQSVTVEADAFEGNTYSGKVTNISLESTASSGVSTYPVTVTLDTTEDLLPGMNVDAYIELASSSDTITIPADALMRGNKVYIKDDTVKDAQGAVPAGFKSVDVTVGLTSDDYVEILTGVDEGDTVYQAKSTTKTTTAQDLFGGSSSENNSGNNSERGRGGPPPN